MKLKGKICSGQGVGAFYVNKISEYFKSQYGIKLFPGTLNVELAKNFVLESNEKIAKKAYGGTQDVILKEVKINGHKAYLLRPEVNNAGIGDQALNILEIAADVCFRKEYHLKDGDEVEIEI